MINAQKSTDWHLKKNALHNELGRKPGTPLPESLLDKKLVAAKASGNTVLEKRIVFAKNAKNFKH